MIAMLRWPDQPGYVGNAHTYHTAVADDNPPLQRTATGYGRRLPTRYRVKLRNRWRRVYCYIYSNAGTFYIEGEKVNGKKQWIIVEDIGESGK